VTYNLNEAELQLVVHCLRVAAAEFAKDAERMRLHRQDRLVEQFERQAKNADDLADSLEA